jgi:hypothetical protein
MENDHTQDPKSLGHEPTGANVRAVRQTAAALAAVVLVSFLVVAGLMKFYAWEDHVLPGQSVAKQVPTPPGTPELNPEQPVELQKLRARERQLLDSYGWIDRAVGVAHIPITEAMKIIAADGLPETPPPANERAEQTGSNRP